MLAKSICGAGVNVTQRVADGSGAAHMDVHGDLLVTQSSGGGGYSGVGYRRDLNRAFDRSRLDRGLAAVSLAESERTAGKVRPRELLQREIPAGQEDEEPGDPGDQPSSCGEVTCG